MVVTLLGVGYAKSIPGNATGAGAYRVRVPT